MLYKKENNKSEPIDLHRMALLCSRRYRIDPVGLFELVTFRKPSTFLKRQVFCLFALFYSFFNWPLFASKFGARELTIGLPTWSALPFRSRKAVKKIENNSRSILAKVAKLDPTKISEISNQSPSRLANIKFALLSSWDL